MNVVVECIVMKQAVNRGYYKYVVLDLVCILVCIEFEFYLKDLNFDGGDLFLIYILFLYFLYQYFI